MPAPRTTIIVSKLTGLQCLTVPTQIKSEIRALGESLGGDDLIQQWSELPFLSRLVVSITSEPLAEYVYKRLVACHPELKIHLSESIRRRNSSFDESLQTPVSPKLGKYEEPEPVKSDDETVDTLTPMRRKTTLVEGLRLNTSIVHANGTTSPMSPTITLEDTDSV